MWAIVPPEYLTVGAPPWTWVIDDIMRTLGAPYYLGLRTAAEFYGATHFPIQTLQVVTQRRYRPFVLGRQTVRFLVKCEIAGTPIQDVAGPITTLRYSTPEATALDLVHFATAAGGMTMVTAALAQMAGRCRTAGMRRALVAADDTPTAQRLGVLWEHLGEERLARAVEAWLRPRELRRIRFDRSDVARRDMAPRWKVRGIPPSVPAL